MKNGLKDNIEALGLSTEACAELRRCGVETVQDLIILINARLIADSATRHGSRGKTYHISLKDAILGVLKDHPDIIYSTEEIREKIVEKYGERTSDNIGSIRGIALSMSYEGLIRRASMGQYFYPSDASLLAKKIEKSFAGKKSSRPPKEYAVVRKTLSGQINTKSSASDKSNFDFFLLTRIGKEIEFKYKSKSSSGEPKWRREVVWGYDEDFLYIEKQYASGRRRIIPLLKRRVIEYRETGSGDTPVKH